MFHKRTLSGKHCVVNNDGRANCYIWPETEGNIGLNEIETYINYFTLQKAKFGIKNV